jgi:hypothetical protein
MFYDICHIQLVQAHDSIADKSEWFVVVCPSMSDSEPKPFRPVKHQKNIVQASGAVFIV